MKKGTKIILYIVIIILTLFVGAGGMYLLITRTSNNNVSSVHKNVNISDNGISESVNKIYDAVVIVTTYLNNNPVASGSGFVYKTEGNDAYIITNNHVINGADSIKVTFSDNKTYDVNLVGGESFADIAVLKIDKKNIKSVALIGKSEDSKLGDTVFTVGAPLDNSYSGTVTRGIVSGKDRLVTVSLSQSSNGGDYIMKVIQTDAAINSGNSGGPLVNVNGEVIGITNMKLVSSGVEGMGFAIPIEDAINYATQIEKTGKIARPVLGITMANTVNSLFDLYKNNSSSLVVVDEVQSKSAAEEAGIKKGDIIKEIDGVEITSAATLRYQLYRHNVGDVIKVKVQRDNEEKTFKVKLQAGE